MKMNSFEKFDQNPERLNESAKKYMLAFFLTLASFSNSEAQTNAGGPNAPIIPNSEMKKEANSTYNIPAGEVRGYRLGRTTDSFNNEAKEAPDYVAPPLSEIPGNPDRSRINKAIRLENIKIQETQEAPAYKIPTGIQEKTSEEVKKYFGPGNGPDNKKLNPE